jgi:hypothetical protein
MYDIPKINIPNSIINEYVAHLDVCTRLCKRSALMMNTLIYGLASDDEREQPYRIRGFN